jgi:hypothetical protein
MVNPVFLFVLLQHNIHPYQCDLIHIVNMFKKIKLGGGGGGGGGVEIGGVLGVGGR